MSERYTETASAETARSDVAATSLPFTAGENGSYTRFIQCYLEDKERLDQYLFPLVNIGARNNVNIADKEFLEGRNKLKLLICLRILTTSSLFISENQYLLLY